MTRIEKATLAMENTMNEEKIKKIGWKWFSADLIEMLVEAEEVNLFKSSLSVSYDVNLDETQFQLKTNMIKEIICETMGIDFTFIVSQFNKKMFVIQKELK